MKFEINEFENNIDILLANLIVEKANMFRNPVSNSITVLNSIGGIHIKKVSKGQTFEDMIDGGFTAIVEGIARVALNQEPRFWLKIESDGFGVLDRVSESGVTLHRTFLDVHFD